MNATDCEVLGQPALDAALIIATVIGTGFAVTTIVLTVLLTVMVRQTWPVSRRVR